MWKLSQVWTVFNFKWNMMSLHVLQCGHNFHYTRCECVTTNVYLFFNHKLQVLSINTMWTATGDEPIESTLAKGSVYTTSAPYRSQLIPQSDLHVHNSEILLLLSVFVEFVLFNLWKFRNHRIRISHAAYTENWYVSLLATEPHNAINARTH